MSAQLTPREIIKRVIHFQDPPRVGLYFGRFGVDDTVDVFDYFTGEGYGQELN